MIDLKLWRYAVVAAVVAALLSAPVAAYVPYQSYTYSMGRGAAQVVYSSTPYIPETAINSYTLGEDIQTPEDIFFDAAGDFYITDSGENRVLILDPNGKLKKVLDSFQYDGKKETFSKPSGVYAGNGKLYVCDTENSRIVVLNSDYSCEQVIGTPDSPILGASYVFKPRKIAVDSGGTMYVLNRQEYNGVMKLSANGAFLTFMGANKASVNLTEMIWKKIMTKEQKEGLSKNLPSEYYNISMDKDGFLYVVSQSKDISDPVKRLNQSGADVLVRNGYVGVVGQIVEDSDEKSVFSDIVSDQNGFYYALDSFRGRVYVYDSSGYLFYTFGGKGDELGLFSTASSIEVHGDRVYVADSEHGSITVFRRTDYGTLLTQAENEYNAGKYDESVNLWQEVIRNNSNFELAYAQIGRVFLQSRHYKEAMQDFELGNYRGDTSTGMTGYNKAFIEYRKQVAAKYAPLIVCIILITVAALIVFVKLRKNRKPRVPRKDGAVRRDIRFAFHILTHPLDGFYDMKYEKRGRLWVPLCFILLAILMRVLGKMVTAFLFNPAKMMPVDVFGEAKTLLVGGLVFAIANWSITTLMDGKGKIKDIVMVLGYSALPVILLQLPAALLSNVASYSEAVYIHGLNTIALVWFAFLVFSGLLTVHQYSLTKMTGTVVLTGVAIVCMVFLYLLFFSLFSQMSAFVLGILREIQLR